jgi:hypothetical protein
MITKSGPKTIVERGANKTGLNVATNIMRGTLGKQWSINRDDGGLKAIRNFRLSASHEVPARSGLS